MSALVDTALDYAARGWLVLPVRGRGKVPLTGHGLHDATVDGDRVAAWWSRWPSANVGLRTGDAFHVLDVDSGGAAALHAAISKHGDDFPRFGPCARTGGGGRHIYFAPATPVGNRCRFLPGCDWRGQGGYVIAPPSVHASGGRYEWVRGPDAPLPAVPGWLLDVLDPPRPMLEPRAPVTVGSRYAEAAFGAEVHEVEVAPEGCRNHTTVRAAFNLGTLVGAGLLSEGDVEEALVTAARAAGLGEREARSTVLSGLRAGMERPREVAS
jgi:hypothetical protein